VNASELDQLDGWLTEGLDTALERRAVADAMLAAARAATAAEQDIAILEELGAFAAATWPRLDVASRSSLGESATRLRIAAEALASSDRQELVGIAHRLRDLLRGVRRDATGALNEPWKRWCAEGNPELQSQGAALAKVPALQTVCDRIRRYELAVRAAQSKFPPSDPTGALDNLEAERQAIEAELGRCGLSESVVRFLLAAAGGRAKLGDVDTEIHDWLEANGVSDRVRLKLL
jgi:hypothetical protein